LKIWFRNTYRGFEQMAIEQIPVPIGALIIATAGGVGGLLNSALINLNIVKASPTLSIDIDKHKSIRLTYLVNVITGFAAALVSWGLYGSAAIGALGIFGDMHVSLLTISSLLGAFGIGFSGSSWLTTHADKKAWQENTKNALNIDTSHLKNDDINLSQKVRSWGPAEASKVINEIVTNQNPIN
jgi:hypothetical protein